MTDHTDIVERLNACADDPMWAAHCEMSKATARKAAAEITRLRAESAQLRSVMIAAAEEIQAHWPAHCDAEGYGPANLMRRLEEGIPSQYAYTAGDFERLRAEAEALRKDAERYRWLREESEKKHDFYSNEESWMVSRQQGGFGQNFFGVKIDIAIDAAIDATKGTT